MISNEDTKQLHSLANTLIEDVGKIYPALTFRIIVHGRGSRQEEIHRSLNSLNGHPAQHYGRDLFARRHNDKSAVAGITFEFERGFLGMKGKPHYLGFVTLNVDQYKTVDQAKYDLFNLVCQFFDMMGMIRPETLKSDRRILMPPKRATLDLARTNMRADIFSALMMNHYGQKNSIMELAGIRGMQALVTQAYQHPEDYPYPICIDVAGIAQEKLHHHTATNILKAAYQTSGSIARSFDEDNFSSWTHFAAPAQSMAWSGSSPEQILGAAIHTCPNPFIKSIGNIVAEATNVVPVSAEEIRGGLNPFIDIEINKINHERQIEENFEMAMMHAVEVDSNLPMLRVANNQNDGMTKGNVMGWCAHALQASAKAYQTALKRGAAADQAARLEFQSAQQLTDWSALNKLNQHVVSQRRDGYAVTMSDLAKWCKTNVDLRPVMESLQMTLDDPSFNQKLAAQYDMPSPNRVHAPQAAPATRPAPAMSGPQPVFAAAPQLNLGGGMTGGIGGGAVTQKRPPTTPDTSDDE